MSKFEMSVYPFRRLVPFLALISALTKLAVIRHIPCHQCQTVILFQLPKSLNSIKRPIAQPIAPIMKSNRKDSITHL